MSLLGEVNRVRLTDDFSAKKSNGEYSHDGVRFKDADLMEAFVTFGATFPELDYLEVNLTRLVD